MTRNIDFIELVHEVTKQTATRTTTTKKHGKRGLSDFQSCRIALFKMFAFNNNNKKLQGLQRNKKKMAQEQGQQKPNNK